MTVQSPANRPSGAVVGDARETPPGRRTLTHRPTPDRDERRAAKDRERAAIVERACLGPARYAA